MLEAAEHTRPRRRGGTGARSARCGRTATTSTSVGDALCRAAAGLGVEADGRGFEALAEVVVVAAEARGGALDW